MERDKAMDKEKEKLYIVCNSAKEIAPRHILRIYKRKSAEKVVGDNDDLTILGEKDGI